MPLECSETRFGLLAQIPPLKRILIPVVVQGGQSEDALEVAGLQVGLGQTRIRRAETLLGDPAGFVDRTREPLPRQSGARFACAESLSVARSAVGWVCAGPPTGYDQCARREMRSDLGEDAGMATDARTIEPVRKTMRIQARLRLAADVP